VPKVYTDDDVKKWIAMRDKGYPLKEISKKHRVFGGTVLKKIKEYEEKLAMKEAAKKGTVGEEAKSPAGEKLGKEEASQEEELPPYIRKTPPRIKKKSEGDKVAEPRRLEDDERIEAKKSLRFDPDLLKIAEWMVEQGLAKDLSSAVRAWGKDYYYRHSDVLKENDIEPKIQKGNDLGKDIDFSDVIKLMKQRVAMDTMATLSGEKKGDAIDLNKIIALSFLERQYKGGDGNPGTNPQIQALQNEIRELKNSQMQQAQMQKFETMFQNLQAQILAKGKNGGDWKDILALTEKSKADLEKIRAEHEARIEQQRAKTEAAKEEASKIQFEHLREEVKNLLNQTGETHKWKDEITKKYMDQAMTILDEQYKKGAKAVAGEKTTGELAKDFVTDFVDKIKTPILEPMGQALAKRMEQEPQGLNPQQAQVIQEAQEKYKQRQQQLAKEAELKKQGTYDLMD